MSDDGSTCENDGVWNDLLEADKDTVNRAYLKLCNAINEARMTFEEESRRRLQLIAVTYNPDGSLKDKKIRVYKRK